jgi:hypothetical protein
MSPVGREAEVPGQQGWESEVRDNLEAKEEAQAGVAAGNALW